jgi:hypothetical protein
MIAGNDDILMEIQEKGEKEYDEVMMVFAVNSHINL